MAKMKIIISGGGTGGHIFPAISIANELRKKLPQCEILFVGALGRMEMEKVPSAGYEIVGLPVMGFPRKPGLCTLKFFISLLKSIRMARKVVRQFAPDVAVGVGGYASGPVLRVAVRNKIPALIQEQNSFAGITNRLLAKKIDKVCVAYDHMERFFPHSKIVFTGNPVRNDLLGGTDKIEEAKAFFQVANGKKVILVLGGSLGARTLNNSLLASIDKLMASDVEVIWQTGKYYYPSVIEQLKDKKHPNIHVHEFLSRMDLAFALSDLVVSRAGAGTISELCLMSKPCILVPSPNVAEDHQTKNALALVEKNAAILIPDQEAGSKLIDQALLLVKDEEKLKQMALNIAELAKPNAASDIANLIIKLAAEKMKGIDTIKNLYFVGIGGIGMSALARYGKRTGRNVAGYDLTETPLTQALVAEGIDVHYNDCIHCIPSTFCPENTLVVRTPAVPASHSELNHFIEKGFPLMKRSELLGFLTQSQPCIAVAGTHGKTSVSTMVTHLLLASGIDAGAFLGGISRNFNSNLVLPQGDPLYVVTEADEFDRSFLQLSPSIAVITSMDADHLDIYGDHQALTQAFGHFVQKLRPEGVLIAKKGLPVRSYMNDGNKLYTYSLNEEADFYTKNLRIEAGAYWFDLIAPNSVIENICFTYPGRVNVENMVAASAVALLCGAGPAQIKNACLTYLGVERRFDIQYKSESVTYIDDYAHHPEELRATIRSVKELYAGKKVLGIFQPHLFSRTRDFADGFAQSLDELDEAILLDIYPARELPITGVTSELIFGKMKNDRCFRAHLDQIPEMLEDFSFDVLISLGAGNIDTLVPKIVQWLKNREK
jgi:UDP-N-acetylmuramate--alanine ligase